MEAANHLMRSLPATRTNNSINDILDISGEPEVRHPGFTFGNNATERLSAQRDSVRRETQRILCCTRANGESKPSHALAASGGTIGSVLDASKIHFPRALKLCVRTVGSTVG